MGSLEELWEDEEGANAASAMDGNEAKESRSAFLLWGNKHAATIASAVHSGRDVGLLEFHFFAIDFDGRVWGFEVEQEEINGDLAIVEVLFALGFEFIGFDAAFAIDTEANAVDEAVFLIFDLDYW